MRFEGPHWSATQFMCWEQCPAEYKARYVDGVAIEITEPLAFGQAVHQGLEAHFRGDDGERTFRTIWKDLSLRAGSTNRRLTGIGMELIDKVIELGLRGEPERPFTLNTELVLNKPIVGAIDLWGSDGVLYDFKTTIGAWSQERAQRECWQPVLYSWAAFEQTGEVPPAFEYIVLNRASGRLDRFRREWTLEDWGEQWDVLYERMRVIAASVADGELGCHGKHGTCPECGRRWVHGHVCEPEHRGRQIRLGRTAA